MPYDERLAGRVRAVMANADGVRERKMFGGLAFLLNGNMCCGLVRNDLMVRVGPDDYEQSLQRAHARAMDFTGKPMKGFVYVSPAGVASETNLRGWVSRGLDFARSLPAK